MSAPAIPLTAAEVITCGRALYRAVQDATWPQDEQAIGVLMRASSRLSTEIGVCARVQDDGFPVTTGRVASARKAASDLIAAAVACGLDVTAVTGSSEGQAAA